MVANTVNDLRAGPTEISWMLYDFVEPILREYLRPIITEDARSGKVISIDEVFFDRANKGNKREAESARRIAEEEIIRRAENWIEEGLSDLYAAQTFFDREMRKAEEPRPSDTHIYETYEEYHRDYVHHLQRIIKASGDLPKVTINELQKVIDYDTREAGLDLSRKIYLGLRHGAHGITTHHSYPVVFQLSRIKDPLRMASKFARYLVEGIEEWMLLRSYLPNNGSHQESDAAIAYCIGRLQESRSEDDRKTAEKIIENFGAMHAHGLKTPFSSNEELHIGRDGIDPMEYLLMRCRVSDVLGVINVTRTREDAELLLKRTIENRFQSAHSYGALFGKVLRKEKEGWQYVDGFVIDRHGERRTFIYVTPRTMQSENNIRIDFGYQALRENGEDAVAGRHSHLRHEARQAAKVQRWSRIRQQLYYTIEKSARSPLEQLNIERYEVYKGFPFQQEGARAK